MSIYRLCEGMCAKFIELVLTIRYKVLNHDQQELILNPLIKEEALNFGLARKNQTILVKQ